jgi:branched-chain amino acid transport system ATP-binding protein
MKHAVAKEKMKSHTSKIMLEVDSINTFYGKAQVLFDLNFVVNRGEVVVLLGRNGAGKSTTFKSIIGIVPPASGHITFNGTAIHDLPPHKTCALGLGYVPEDRRIFSKLTIMENLAVGRQPPRTGFEPWTPARLVELFPNLGEKSHQYGGHLSGGEQQMLTIARSLMGNPEMIILDEPSEGLAPVIVDQLAQTILRLKAEGVSVILAEQNLNFARFICDRAYIIQQGRVCHESMTAELSQTILEKYLSI